MSAMQPITIDCPMCGALIGWNITATTGPAVDGQVPVTLGVTLDDLSRRRHRRCGILPPAS